MFTGGSEPKSIVLPLDSGNLDFFKTFSSDDFQRFVGEGYLGPDMGTTYFERYALLMQQILNSTSTPSDMGFGIDHTFHNPAVAIPFWAAQFGLGVANAVRVFKTKKKDFTRNSYTLIQEQLRSECFADDVLEDDVKDSVSAESKEEGGQKELPKVSPEEQKILIMKFYLNAVLQRDPKLNEKYQSISIEQVDDEHEDKSKNKKKTRLLFLPKKQKESEEVKKPEKEQEEQEKQDNRNYFIRLLDRTKKAMIRVKNRSTIDNLLAFKDSWLNKSCIAPLIDGTFLGAFTYWILWGNTLSYTDNMSAGAGLPTGVAFGIPGAVAGSYFAIKLARFAYHKYYGIVPLSPEQQELNEEAASLFRQASALKKFLTAKKNLEKRFGRDIEPWTCTKELTTMDAEIDSLGANPLLNATVAGVKDIVGYFGVVQYVCWFVTDFLQRINVMTSNIPIVNLVVGSLLLTWSVVHAACSFAESFSARSKHAAEARKALAQAEESKEKTLEAIYQEKLDYIKSQKREGRNVYENDAEFLDVTHPQFYGDKTRSDSSFQSTVQKMLVNLMVVVNAVTTGVFFMRCFFVPGTAVLPFAAVVLNPVVGLGVVFGLGAAFAGVALYKHLKDRRDQEAAVIKKQRPERVRYLKDQIELVHIVEQGLKKPAEKKLVPQQDSVSAERDTSSNVVAFEPKRKGSSGAQLFDTPDPSSSTAAIEPAAKVRRGCALM